MRIGGSIPMNQDIMNVLGVLLPLFRGNEGNKDIWENRAGEGFVREKGQSPGTPWTHLPHETKLNDLRSLTVWDKGGTSEGDKWDPQSIEAAKRIVGNSKDVTMEHIEQFERYMISSGNMAFMSEHHGKKAYTPSTEKGLTPDVLSALLEATRSIRRR